MVRAMSCDIARINSLPAKYFISTKPYDLYRGTVRIIDVTIKQFLEMGKCPNTENLQVMVLYLRRAKER